MAVVKFTSIDVKARTATFDVDGNAVTRNIPERFEGTIDDYVKALARGLAIEFEPNKITEIEAPKIKAGDTLVSPSIESA